MRGVHRRFEIEEDHIGHARLGFCNAEIAHEPVTELFIVMAMETVLKARKACDNKRLGITDTETKMDDSPRVPHGPDPVVTKEKTNSGHVAKEAKPIIMMKHSKSCTMSGTKLTFHLPEGSICDEPNSNHKDEAKGSEIPVIALRNHIHG